MHNRTMPQSLAAIYVHGVFSTKNRQPVFDNVAFRRDVHAYIAGVAKRLDCPALEIGGVADHVHVLARLGRTITVAEWMKETKRVSSAFVNETIKGFAWQSGYGAFSVSATDVDKIVHYIRNQEEHHKTFSFQDEFRKLLSEHGIEWDEEYVWD